MKKCFKKKLYSNLILILLEGKYELLSCRWIKPFKVMTNGGDFYFLRKLTCIFTLFNFKKAHVLGNVINISHDI